MGNGWTGGKRSNYAAFGKAYFETFVDELCFFWCGLWLVVDGFYLRSFVQTVEAIQGAVSRNHRCWRRGQEPSGKDEAS